MLKDLKLAPNHMVNEPGPLYFWSIVAMTAVASAVAQDSVRESRALASECASRRSEASCRSGVSPKRFERDQLRLLTLPLI